jgi:hypothetical protein
MVYAHRPLACRAFDCRIFALPGNGASFPVSEDGKHTTPFWEFDIRSKRDALIRDAFILGAAPWLFHRRRDDCNTVMATVVASFSHNAAIVEAMRAKLATVDRGHLKFADSAPGSFSRIEAATRIVSADTRQ